MSAVKPDAEQLYCAGNQEELLREIRKVQQRTKCTNTTCLDFIALFSKYFGEGKLPTTFDACDKELKKAAGVDVFTLNGCIGCHRHVYGPEDARDHCPRCGYERYNANTGKPHEVCALFRHAQCSMPSLTKTILCPYSARVLLPLKATF